MFLKETITEILERLPDLNAHGFRCYGNRVAISNSEHSKLRDDLRDANSLGGLSPARVEQLAGWLSSFNPSHRWKLESYALKHTFERETGTYMINGAFIVGVIMAGFEIKVAAPNALIKAQRPAR
jgi:hypothetical protein